MPLLNWLKRKEPPPPSPARALAMVLLPSVDSIVNSGAVFAHLRAHWPDLPEIADVTSEQGATAARIPGGALGFVQLPMPVPAGDLEGPTAVAWHWPSARKVVSGHGSHVVVHAASATLDALDLRLLHTKLVAAIAAVASALGVYVGGAMLVRSSEEYIADAEGAARDNLPLLSWVGFNPVPEADGSNSGYTTGLSEFGFLELEIRQSQAPPSEVLGTLADAANYQLDTGQCLGDGETFGFSETDRRRIRHVRSAFLPNTTVATIET